MAKQSKITFQRHPVLFLQKLPLKLDLDWFIHLRGKIASVWLKIVEIRIAEEQIMLLKPKFAFAAKFFNFF